MEYSNYFSNRIINWKTMKTHITLLFLIGILQLQAQQNIEETWPLKWKTEIGLTSYRTNIICEQGKIFIGSNGKIRDSKEDTYDGVYILDASSGILGKHIIPKTPGDNDVNGVLIYKDRIFFGTDNYTFYCYDMYGNEIWKYKTEYDVESCPVSADLNNDDYPDVVFTVEGKGLVALDGKSGVEIWRFRTDRNRGYNGSPAVYDVNNDGVMDFLIGGEGDPSIEAVDGFKMYSYGDHAYCINGLDGSVLWAVEMGSKIHASPLIIEKDGDAQFVFTESYGGLLFVDRKGERLKYIGTEIGLFSTPTVSHNGEAVLVGHSWWDDMDEISYHPIRDDYFQESRDHYLMPAEKYNENAKSVKAYKTSATAVYADLNGNGKYSWLIPNEKGLLFEFDENGNNTNTYSFPTGAEAAPYVGDIDNDGYLEILISSLDGYLYCYDTKSKGKVFWGSFRGPENNGLVRIK
jgi:hypothetical protein